MVDLFLARTRTVAVAVAVAVAAVSPASDGRHSPGLILFAPIVYRVHNVFSKLLYPLELYNVLYFLHSS